MSEGWYISPVFAEEDEIGACAVAVSPVACFSVSVLLSSHVLLSVLFNKHFHDA